MPTLTTGDLGEGGATCEASDGIVYGVFITTAGNLAVYDDIMGSPSLGDSDTPTVVHGGGTIVCVGAVIDSADLIHIVSVVSTVQTRDIAYNTYNTTTSTLGTWEEAQPYDSIPDAPAFWAAIAVDGSDYPYIGYLDGVNYHGGTYAHLFNTDKSSGSWSAPERCTSWADNSQEDDHYGFALGPGSDLHVYWTQVSFDTIYYRSRISGSWGSTLLYSSANQESSSANKPWPLICVTSADVVYRVWADERIGATSVRIYENNGATVSVDITDGFTPIAFTILKDSDYRYGLLIDESDDLHLIGNEGSWANYGAIETGTFERVASGWGYHNPPTCVNYLYTDGTTVYSGQVKCPVLRRVFTTFA